jgi:aminopeptidase N
MIVSLQRLWLAVLLAVAAAAPCTAAPFSFDTTPGRLSKDVVPRDYRIAIVPDVAARRFSGTEIVQLEVRKAVRTIRLDSLNERLRDVRFDGKPVRAVASDDAQQLTTIDLVHEARPGAHMLAFAYTGHLETEPRGLFVQRYTRDDGTTASMLSTQFESIDARRMFPGWDEPTFRARFTLSVTVPSAWATIGNMPIAQRFVHGALATTTFQRTPPMASYLLEFTGGDLTALDGRSGSTPISVWAVRGRSSEGAYALASAQTILADYNDYFGVAYPLPKLDLIAIPGGFPGAMENWGAITFDAGNLLAHPLAGIESHQSIFGDYLSHEMAHLWTGDLVTMAWWNDIWLNESFANWRSAAETDERYPEWHWWERQDADKEVAMAADARRSSHPLALAHLDERQADAAFDSDITYSKGQAFLHMLVAYLGPDRFRAGMQHYLRAHAYSNATSTDLWNALGAASGIDVARFSRAWTTQPGFPLVSVRATCDAAGARTIVLSQQRFLLGGSDADRTRWIVPLQLRTATSPTRLVVLPPAGATVAAGRCDEALSLNAGGAGYYRVAYDPPTLALDTAAFAALPAADQIVLLDDQWALAAAGRAPLASYLALARALGTTHDERAWDQVLDALGEIADAERGTPGEAAYLAFARSIAAPLAARLGWTPVEGESVADAALRPRVLEALGAWNDPAILAAARDRFARVQHDPAAFTPELRAVIVRLVARNADAPTFDAIHTLARTATDQDTQSTDYAALMRVRDPALASQALAIALSDELPPALASDRIDLVLTIADRFPAMVWPVFRDHAAMLLAPQGSTGPEFAAAEIPRSFWRAVPLPELAAWLDAHAPTERTIGIPRGLETAEDLLLRTPRLIAGADAYVAGARSGTSARISSSSGIASRNAPTIRGS